MIFPFEALAGAARESGLLVGLAIGFAFGFVLERAGFGRATKLAAQFYLRDMTVFKVMFSAIVTAMLGLVLFAAAGLVDLRAVSESIASWTYLGPMLVGGFVLGLGFILSGYCPGTSLVAASSGNVDGMVTVGGVVAGSWLYSEMLRIPALASFHDSGERGAFFLYDLLPLSPGVLAAAFAALALAAFVGAEVLEGRFARPKPARRGGSRRAAFAAIAAGALLALGSTRLPDAVAPSLAPPGAMEMSAFARRLVEEPWTMRVLDLRSAEAFAAARIPGSELARWEDVPLLIAPERREVVLVTEAGRLPGPLAAGTARVLRGGFAAWNAYALTPPQSAGGPPEEIRFRASLHAALTGAAAAAPPPPPAPTAPIQRPKKKGGGCSA